MVSRQNVSKTDSITLCGGAQHQQGKYLEHDSETELSVIAIPK